MLEMLRFKDFLNEEDGIGVVEMILILVVLIAMVLIFKEQISGLVTKIFAQISTDSDSIMAK